MILISKDGTQERRCLSCERMRPDTYCVNPTARKAWREYVCEDCHSSVLETILADAQRQVDAGIPQGQRMILFPIWLNTERLHGEVRDGLLALNDPTAEKSVYGVADSKRRQS